MCPLEFAVRSGRLAAGLRVGVAPARADPDRDEPMARDDLESEPIPLALPDIELATPLRAPMLLVSPVEVPDGAASPASAVRAPADCVPPTMEVPEFTSPALLPAALPASEPAVPAVALALDSPVPINFPGEVPARRAPPCAAL
ncbi:MAG: hypothetical protein WBW93_03210 [Steroidobacteraceae bacterium]